MRGTSPREIWYWLLLRPVTEAPLKRERERERGREKGGGETGEIETVGTRICWQSGWLKMILSCVYACGMG